MHKTGTDIIGAFDLFHQRYGLTQVPTEVCGDVARRLFSLIRSGGYIQFVDADLLGFKGAGHEETTEMMIFVMNFFAMGASGPKLESWLKEVGAEVVEVKEMTCPMVKRAETSTQQELFTWNQLTLVKNFTYFCSSK